MQQRFLRIPFKKKTHSTRPRLQGCPQKHALVIKPRIVTPRKPNSARRPVVKSRLSNYKKVTAHIPGKGHAMKRYNKIYIRGGGARDLPGVRYSCIRGILDCRAIKTKTKRRSIYGVCRPPVKEGEYRHIRRRHRRRKKMD